MFLNIMKYKGCIIKESLTNTEILKHIEIIKTRIEEGDNKDEKWHIYDVLVFEHEIDKIHKFIRKGWYIHFWHGNKMIVLFKGKKFVLDIKNKKTWKPAVEHGLSLGISKEQLDFEIEF